MDAEADGGWTPAFAVRAHGNLLKRLCELKVGNFTTLG
jgi:hypothetical protein